MKIYVVLDLNGDYTNVFTTKKAAEKYYKNDKENAPLKPPEKFEIPITKEGIIRAIHLGANWGGGGVGFGGWQYVTKQLKCFLLINKGDRDEKN